MFKCTEVESNGRRPSRKKKEKRLQACACCEALASVRRASEYYEEDAEHAAKNGEATAKGKAEKSLLGKVFGQVRKEPQRGSTNGASAAGSGAGARAEAGALEGAEAAGEWNPDIDGALVGPPKRKMWHGLDGLAVTVFGIAAPALLIALSAASMPKRITLMLLNHPVETAVEILLLALIPFANFFVWNAITRNRLKFSRAAAMALGASIAACLITTGVCVAALFTDLQQFAEAIGTDFTLGFAWMAGLSLLAGAASGYVAYRVRNSWDLDSTRRQIVLCSGIGVVTAALLFVGAEAKSWITRSAEKMAVSSQPEEAARGMAWLRQLNPERDLRMECSDARAAGLAGLFMPIKMSAEHELYFKLTGKPYSFREFANSDLSSMPDEVLSANVVGERIKGLSLARSTMTGTVHPNTLSSTFEWTFVFKNDTQSAKEMRAEIGLPPGAVVKGLTVWNKGEANDAQFTRTSELPSYGSSYGTVSGPGAVTDLGHGRVLVSAYPIPQDVEAKIRVTMVLPVNPEAGTASSLVLPRFIATNFDLKGEQAIKLHSSLPLKSGLKTLAASKTGDGQFTLAGNVSAEDLTSSRLVVEATRPEVLKPVYYFDSIATQAARDEQIANLKARRAKAREERKEAEDSGNEAIIDWIDDSKDVNSQLAEIRQRENERFHRVVKVLEKRFVVQRTERVTSSAPRSLQIVVDGSASVGEHAKEIAEALRKLPASVKAEVVLASQEPQPLTNKTQLPKAIDLLLAAKFVGGQDNLKAVVKAAERAGDTTHGAVLWIHGPQPTSNHEIHIMSPYTSAPEFFELPVGEGDTTDAVEYFRNHTEIGPFKQVARSADHAGDDLKSFFKKWESDQTTLVKTTEFVRSKPKDAVEISGQEGQEVMILHAAQKAQRELENKAPNAAADTALAYGFVGKGTQAIISDVVLQGATNGTISGVNTAGTVRVNNLANLEALLNIIANIGEIVLMLGGGILIMHGFARGNVLVEVMGQEFEFSPGKRISLGALLLIGGLALPGTINWFVASARDANLFS